MIDYTYDGTFEGLLTCIYYNYYGEEAVGIFERDRYQPNFLTGFRDQVTEEDKADIVYKAIGEKISYYDLKRLYRAYRSSEEGKDTVILEYVRLGFREGDGVNKLHGDATVFALQRIEGRVSTEIHRLKGLIRFSLLGNQVLYSAIEPDHDIVEFFGPHFSDRFMNEAFIIHDVRRNKALFSARGKWYISELSPDQVPPDSQEEQKYQRLWRDYFRTIAIKERTNPRCQKNFMPVRYWKHLTEMK